MSEITVLIEVGFEMKRQVEKWGVQNHSSYSYPDVLSEGVMLPDDHVSSSRVADVAKYITDKKADLGSVSYLDIFLEEAFEARDEAFYGDIPKLREELIQVAAVACSWVQSIDRNNH